MAAGHAALKVVNPFKQESPLPPPPPPFAAIYCGNTRKLFWAGGHCQQDKHQSLNDAAVLNFLKIQNFACRSSIMLEDPKGNTDTQRSEMHQFG